MNTYHVEIPGGYTEFEAATDEAAVKHAKAFIRQNVLPVLQAGLKLFRLPLNPMHPQSEGRIEVPFYPAVRNCYHVVTTNGFVTYARFAGGTCEAWDYGSQPVGWNQRAADRIAKALKKSGVQFGLRKEVAE